MQVGYRESNMPVGRRVVVVAIIAVAVVVVAAAVTATIITVTIKKHAHATMRQAALFPPRTTVRSITPRNMRPKGDHRAQHQCRQSEVLRQQAPGRLKRPLP